MHAAPKGWGAPTRRRYLRKWIFDFPIDQGRHRLPRQWHHREPRRQGTQARNLRAESRGLRPCATTGRADPTVRPVHHSLTHRCTMSRHHLRHRCSGNRALPLALAPAPVQGQLRTPADITPRTASCIAVRTVAAHTPRRLRRAPCASGYSPSLISQINAIRTPFGASFITPHAPVVPSQWGARLSYGFVRERRQMAPGCCWIECILHRYTAIRH